MDFVEVRDELMTFGDPRATDRCQERANSYEGWSFERVAFTPEIEALLAARPEQLPE